MVFVGGGGSREENVQWKAGQGCVWCLPCPRKKRRRKGCTATQGPGGQRRYQLPSRISVSLFFGFRGGIYEPSNGSGLNVSQGKLFAPFFFFTARVSLSRVLSLSLALSRSRSLSLTQFGHDENATELRASTCPLLKRMFLWSQAVAQAEGGFQEYRKDCRDLVSSAW